MDHREQKPDIALPLSVITVSDARRLMQELESVDDFIVQTKIRTPGKQVQLPKTSKTLDDLSTQNNLNLLLEDDCKLAKNFLKTLLQTAPIIHISFASDPPAQFLAKILWWFRENISKVVLLEIGLQPTIAAGCVVRTANRVFDLSLRKRLQEYRSVLLDNLERLG